MRFHQLRPGARFRYKETIYRKISPLRGASETDETQKLVPRSAEVTLVDEQGQAVAAKLPQSLDSGQLAGATLDATKPEPLPVESPLWSHERVTIMPHTARRVRPEAVGPQVAEAIRRDKAGEPQLWAVDRSAGY